MSTALIPSLLAVFISLGVVLMAVSQNKKKGPGAAAAQDNDDAR